MTGNLHFLVRRGTSGDGPMSLAPKWTADPYGTFVTEWIKAGNYADANGIARRIFDYLPHGCPSTGVFPLDQPTRMRAADKAYYETTNSTFREFAPQSETYTVYTGSPEAFTGTRKQAAANVRIYGVQGFTSIAFDQAADMADCAINRGLLDDALAMFEAVYVEGQFRRDNPWMKERGVRNIITADWRPSTPSLYIPMGAGDMVMVSNVPGSMAQEPAEVKRAWKEEQAKNWLRSGVDVAIDVDVIADVTYSELAGG